MRLLVLAVLVLGLWVGEVEAACVADAAGGGQTCAVSLQTQGFTSSGTWTGSSNARTADTNAYAANDVVGTNTSAGGAVLTFPNIGPAAGGEVLITSASFEIDDTAVISGETSYNLYLYNVSPGSNLADNAPFDIPSGDRANLVAKIGLGMPVDEGSTLLVQSDGVNKQVSVPSGGTLYGYLVTVGGYTPSSARVFKVKLKATGL